MAPAVYVGSTVLFWPATVSEAGSAESMGDGVTAVSVPGAVKR